MAEWEPMDVPAFGGGLNFATHPRQLRPDEWTFSNAFEPRDNCALQMVDAVQLHDNTWVPASNEAIGIVPDVIKSGNIFLIPVRNTGTGAMRLFRISSGGVTSEPGITGATQGASSASDGRSFLTPAVCGGLQVLAFGIGAGQSCITYDGTTGTLIAPGFTLRGQYCTAAASHAFIGGDLSGTTAERTVNVSDADFPTSTGWDPSIANSADNVPLDAHSRIAGIVETSDGVVVVTEDALFYFRSTGGQNPPFTVTRALGAGSFNTRGWAAQTPVGTVCWLGGRLATVGGGALAGAEKCAAYAVSGTSPIPALPQGMFKMVWDTRRSALVFPRLKWGNVSAGHYTSERLYMNPATGAWWRKVWEGGDESVIDHAMGMPGPVGTTVPRYAFMRADGTIFSEDAVDPDGSTAGTTGAFVDTKDFAFGDPFMFVDVGYLRVEWECLTNANNDSLQIFVAMRDSFAPAVLGSPGLDMQNFSYTLLGQVTGGVSDVPIRPFSGKVFRFRFQPVNGRVRIRGFTFWWKPAGRRPAGVSG